MEMETIEACAQSRPWDTNREAAGIITGQLAFTARRQSFFAELSAAQNSAVAVRIVAPTRDAQHYASG